MKEPVIRPPWLAKFPAHEYPSFAALVEGVRQRRELRAKVFAGATDPETRRQAATEALAYLSRLDVRARGGTPEQLLWCDKCVAWVRDYEAGHFCQGGFCHTRRGEKE